MIAESHLHLAIQQLGAREQVPLVAGGPVPHSSPSPDHSESARHNDLYVRLGVPLTVSVESGHNGIFVRGDLEKMNWAPYQSIAMGLRKLIAARLDVDVEVVAMNKLLVVAEGQATQYVEIVAPPDRSLDFTDQGTQDDVQTFLRVVKGEPLPAESSVTHDAEQVPSRTLAACDDGSWSERTRSLAIDFGREVRAAVGGKTLPAACTIDSPGWSAPMQLTGKLGDRLRPPPSEPEERIIDCVIDGYLKSQRVVHLLPVSSAGEQSPGAKHDGRKIVAFDEEEWFAQIANLAPKQGLVARATYQYVTDGKKQLLQLVDLTTVTGPRDDA